MVLGEKVAIFDWEIRHLEKGNGYSIQPIFHYYCCICLHEEGM